MVALLLITHAELGKILLQTVRQAWGGQLPFLADAVAIESHLDPEAAWFRCQQAIERLSNEAGILVCTDLYGATPSNIANRLRDLPGVRVLAGVNLPMLMRAVNYAHLPLEALCEKALAGGHEGILDCRELPRYHYQEKCPIL